MKEENGLIYLEAIVPLAKLSSFSTDFRKITSGNGNFSLEFDSYKRLSQYEYNLLLNKKSLI